MIWKDNRDLVIDVYPFRNDKAIAELELNDEKTPIRFPEQIRVIREVTNDEAYKNASSAKILFLTYAF